MSTILKALRRLEDDRQGGSQRDLRLEVAAHSPRSGPRPRGGGLLLALGGGAALALVGMALWFVSAVPPVPQVAAQPESPGNPEDDRVAASEPGRFAPRIPPVAAAPPRPWRAPRPVIPAPPPRVVPAARAVPPPPEVAVAPRRPLPDLRVRRTIWHPERSRRLAVVDVAGGDGPVELREGGHLGSLVVLEILPNGVTFGRDGVEFVRRIGGAPGRY